MGGDAIIKTYDAIRSNGSDLGGLFVFIDLGVDDDWQKVIPGSIPIIVLARGPDLKIYLVRQIMENREKIEFPEDIDIRIFATIVGIWDNNFYHT